MWKPPPKRVDVVARAYPQPFPRGETLDPQGPPHPGKRRPRFPNFVSQKSIPGGIPDLHPHRTGVSRVPPTHSFVPRPAHRFPDMTGNRTFAIWIMPGPRMTTKRAGNNRNTRGNTSSIV